MSDDGFATMVRHARGFFTELAANNEKAWFDARKGHYDAEIRKPAEFFAGLMAEELSRMVGDPVGAKVFRIHRDVRFSKDKTPYKTHLHISFPRGSDDPLVPGFFFALDANEITLHHGVFDLKGEALTRWRAFVDRWGALLEEAIEESGARLGHYGPPPLKRVPKPYDPDHPQGELLRRKGMILTRDLDPGWERAAFFDAVVAGYERFLPVTRLIGAHL